jgi:hypothetical protein
MFNSHVLEVVAGLCFIFFLVSVFVSAVNEWVSAALALRASDLELGLKNLLGEDVASAPNAGPAEPINTARPAVGLPLPASPTGFGMAAALLNHPMIQNTNPVKVLSKKITAPAYLEASTFASVLVDLIVPGPNQQSIAPLRAAVASMTNIDLRNSLLPLIDRAGDSMDRARKNIEVWYDHAMERVSGRYKRRAQAIMFLLGLFFAAGLNVDTITATSHLWNDPVLREHILKQEQSISAAGAAVCDNGASQPGLSSADAEAAQRRKLDCTAKLVADAYSAAALPIGWSEDARHLWTNPWTALRSILGWMITALAACLGAPFWFDLLNKTLGMNSRLTGAKPAKSDPDSSPAAPSPAPVSSPTVTPQGVNAPS